jgi:hypothetical protein
MRQHLRRTGADLVCAKVPSGGCGRCTASWPPYRRAKSAPISATPMLLPIWRAKFTDEVAAARSARRAVLHDEDHDLQDQADSQTSTSRYRLEARCEVTNQLLRFRGKRVVPLYPEGVPRRVSAKMASRCSVTAAGCPVASCSS